VGPGGFDSVGAPGGGGTAGGGGVEQAEPEFQSSGGSLLATDRGESACAEF